MIAGLRAEILARNLLNVIMNVNLKKSVASALKRWWGTQEEKDNNKFTRYLRSGCDFD
jgi:hypothetical protein